MRRHINRSKYSYTVLVYFIIKRVNDCDQCLRKGGKAIFVQLSTICRRCDLPTGVNPCYRSKKCKYGYITVSIITQFLFTFL